MEAKVTILHSSCSEDEEENNFIAFIAYKSIEDCPLQP